MKLRWDRWLYGIGSAIIGGGSSAVCGGLGSVLIAPETFNVSDWPGATNVLKMMAINFVLTGALSMFFYLKQSPLPAPQDEKTTDDPSSGRSADRLHDNLPPDR
jgi:hypothetical protein